MSNCIKSITSNVNGIPYIGVKNINVTAESVTLNLGYAPIQPISYITVRIGTAIPTGTTGTLPIQISLNGNTRMLTTFGGSNVTVADITETGVITLFYDRFNDILQLISAPI